MEKTKTGSLVFKAMKRTPLKRKLPSVSSVRNKADALLTPIIKAAFPRCLLCSGETQVAHHFVHKSQSTRLRYEFDNLIPLCHKCHQALHHNEGFYASRIVAYKGVVWFQNLEKIKREIVKADVHYFIGHLERLKEKLKELAQ